MARLTSARVRRRPRLEIIPFIDIMFFLLATFMMASLAMIANDGIQLDLPQALTSISSEDISQDRTLSIDASGVVYVEGVAVSDAEMNAIFREWARSDPERRIVVQGDYSCNYGDVVSVFDRARVVGLTRLILRTRPAQDS